MKLRFIALLISFLASGFVGVSQPYVVNEKVKKVFSEGFTDVNKNFIITPSSDRKFWATYGDGYYFMQRKIGSPRAVIANADPINKNFYIKSKVLLAPLGTSESSVGVIFLAQRGGKGGFVFEINKKRKFRITDLGTNAYITKEGDNGWLKSKNIAPPTRNNTVEIKGFRGQFDIYINGNYMYSFVNNSYESGKFGTYIGPSAEARIYYFNVYDLDMPGAKPEVNLNNLIYEIEALKLENDSLKNIALMAKYSDADRTAISAIKILEKQLQTINEENIEIKDILKKHDSSSVDSVNQFQSIKLLKKLKLVSLERDSILQAFNLVESLYDSSNLIIDSLKKEILENKTKIGFMNEKLSKLNLDIAESRLENRLDSIVLIEKIPSKPSDIPAATKKIHDSKENIYSEPGFLKNKNSLAPELKDSSTLSEIITTNEGSVFMEVINNNKKEEQISDSLKYFEKTDTSKNLLINIPEDLRMRGFLDSEKIDSLIKNENKSLGLDSMYKDSASTFLENSLREIAKDSSLTEQEKKQSKNESLDTLIIDSNINLTFDTVGAIELLKKDSIYLHTLDIDDQIEDYENTEPINSKDSTKLLKAKFNKAELKD